MGLAHGLKIRLNVPQIGHARLQPNPCTLGVRLYLGLIGQRFRALKVPLLVLLQGDLRLQGLVAKRNLGLFFQLFQVDRQLAQNIFHPRQIGPGVTQTVFRLAATLFVLRDAGGLFQKQPQLFRLRFNNAADRALPDDGIGARPQTGAQEHILYIAPTHRLVIDKVARGPFTGEHPAHRNFSELAPLATRAVVGIVKNQFDAGPAGGFAAGGAVKNHVLHGLAAQLAGPAFAQHPADRVHDVGFAPAVGTDHADQLTGQQKVGGLYKGLESGQLDRIEAHCVGARSKRGFRAASMILCGCCESAASRLSLGQGVEAECSR